MEIEFIGGRQLHHCNMANLVQYDDKKKATALNLWQRFLDLFRISPKQDVIDFLYNVINESPDAKLDGDVYHRFYNFMKLKSLASPAYRNLFKIKTQFLGMNGAKYTFSIDNVDIYSFDTPNSWNSLSKLSFNQMPLVEKYGLIIKDFSANNRIRLKEVYPDVEVKDNYGGDEYLYYSCFFLMENPDLKLTLLEYGLYDLDIMKAYVNEMCDTLKGDDDKAECIDYWLTTLSCSLNHLESEKYIS